MGKELLRMMRWVLMREKKSVLEYQRIFIYELLECTAALSHLRQKRQIPSTMASIDVVEKYTQLNSYPLHRTKQTCHIIFRHPVFQGKMIGCGRVAISECLIWREGVLGQLIVSMVADYNITAAQQSIVYIDEVDKTTKKLVAIFFFMEIGLRKGSYSFAEARAAVFRRKWKPVGHGL